MAHLLALLLLAFSFLATELPMPRGALAKKPRPVPCADGRFRIEGAPLVAGGVVVPFDAVVLRGNQLAIDSGCALRKGKVKATPKATTVNARWPSCGAAKKVVLEGRMVAPGCSTLAGRFKAKGRKAVSFRATRLSCRDGVVDVGGGEQCERDADCAGGGSCATSSCRCEPGSAVCGNVLRDTGEPCDVLAVPSGCEASQQCADRNGHCVCEPAPDVVGRLVTFTPPPPVDVTSFELPAGVNGQPELIRVAGGALTLDPSRTSPVTAFGRCAHWITECLSPPERTLDDCARSAPPCQTAEPWTEAARCCPAGCFPAYETLRRAGVDDIAAFTRAYFEGTCIPGLRAARGLP